jgi:hypothetical protein
LSWKQKKHDYQSTKNHWNHGKNNSKQNIKYFNTKQFCSKNFKEEFLTYLQKSHGIPDYVLFVLKAAGYDRKESIERAVFGDPHKFCDNLQKYARKLMESKDYYYSSFVLVMN